jgi:hypothetical protein
MKNARNTLELIGTATNVAWFVNVATLLAVSGKNSWEKQQTVRLPYAGNVVFYGEKNVEKYADRFSTYGRN